MVKRGCSSNRTVRKTSRVRSMSWWIIQTQGSPWPLPLVSVQKAGTGRLPRQVYASSMQSCSNLKFIADRNQRISVERLEVIACAAHLYARSHGDDQSNISGVDQASLAHGL